MLLIAKFLANIFKILNSEISPKEIACGFALGVWAGLLPISGILPYFITILALVININLSAYFLAAGIFKIISYVVDPLANTIGFSLLTKFSQLKPFWTHLYNMPVIPYTRFNNTIVMGSFVMGFLLLIPMYFIAKMAIVHYRSHIQAHVEKWKIVQAIKASTFYKYYASIQSLRGE